MMLYAFQRYGLLKKFRAAPAGYHTTILKPFYLYGLKLRNKATECSGRQKQFIKQATGCCYGNGIAERPGRNFLQRTF